MGSGAALPDTRCASIARTTSWNLPQFPRVMLAVWELRSWQSPPYPSSEGKSRNHQRAPRIKTMMAIRSIAFFTSPKL